MRPQFKAETVISKRQKYPVGIDACGFAIKGQDTVAGQVKLEAFAGFSVLAIAVRACAADFQQCCFCNVAKCDVHR